MSEPIRILHVFGTLYRGGAESRIMDLYRHMDREKVQFDFLVHTGAEGHFEKEIGELGGRVYRVPRFRIINYVSYCRAFKTFFAEHPEFRAVQGHMTSTAAIYLPIAKKAGISITIAHARSAGVDSGLKGKITRWMRRNLWQKADYLFACSMLAGKAVFGEKAFELGLVYYIPNAIEALLYRFDQEKREALREKLKLTDKFVVGHVGRFHYAKNHEYLVAVFAEILKQKTNALLLLLGDGSGMENVKIQARELGILEKIMFMGNVENPQDYYQVMDYFVFPSRFEGLPGTVIEAQAAGVKCLISDAIASEVMISPLVQADSIGKNPAEWADQVVKSCDYERKDMYETIVKSGFDIKAQAERMLRFYQSGNKEELG